MNRFKEYWKYLVDSFTLEDDMECDKECVDCAIQKDYQDEEEKKAWEGEEDFTGATNQER